MDLGAVETYEQSSTRKYLKWAEHEGKTILVELLDIDEEHPGYKGKPSPHVLINAIVNNGDGTFSEYFNQWVRGAVIFGFLSKRKRGEVFIRKIVQLPPQKGSDNGAWALNATDQKSYDETLAYAKAKQEAEKAAVESLGDDAELPWEA